MSYSLNQISILGARDQMMEEYLETADSSSGSGARYSGSRPQTLANTKRKYHRKGGQGYGYQRRKKKRFPYKYKRQTRYQKKYTSQPHRERVEPIEVTLSEIKEALKEFRFKSEKPGEEDAIVAVVKKILEGVSVLAKVFSDEVRALCYLVAAYMRTRQSRSLVLYISHLLIQIKDESKRWCFPELLKVACLDESSPKDQILLQVKRGEVDILLMTVEMLESIAYSNHELPPIPFACIDHAECILEMQHFRPAYLRLNKLLRVKLNIPCILGLTAAATESNVQALIKQLDFEFTSLEDRLPIPQGKVKLDVLLNASLDDKNKALLKILQQSSGRSIIIICQSQTQSNQVTKLLREYFSSVTLKENSSTAANVISGNRKRRNSDDSQATEFHKAKVPVCKCYFSNMLQDEAERIWQGFAQGSVDIVVTNFPISMTLQRADTVIYFTMPSSCESLGKGGFQVARSEQQGHVHVLLDKEDDKCQLPTPGIPPHTTLHKQVQQILATGKSRAIRGVNNKCLCFLLGRLESFNYLELPGRISNPPSDVKTYRKPAESQLKPLCESLYEELSDFMVPAELKKLHTELKSIASRKHARGDFQVDLFSVANLAQGKQHTEKTPVLGSQSTLPCRSSHGIVSKERPENKVIQKNYINIVENITAQRLTQRFATKLAEEDFITSPSVFNVRGVSEFEQVTQMLEAVVSRLKTTDTPKEMLEIFIKILQESPPLEELARQITSDYESYGGTSFLSSSGGTSSTKANAPPAADEVPVTKTSRNTGQGKKMESKKTRKVPLVQKKMLDFFCKNVDKS